ncbi:hypothetical protein [Rhizohabitans arisaemae]|uniref:hypothetical protein n=1 Tax=Rhizohabitans arisaemae TaxID=2720610 RepID=UPI0024B28122|nr:hypothetical protein [Rhizohabitans arisaemae]
MESIAAYDRDGARPNAARMREEFGDRIAPITGEVVQEWGRMNVPESLPVVDGLIAATARVNDWILVTRNTKDYTRTGVRLLNPFIPAG